MHTPKVKQKVFTPDCGCIGEFVQIMQPKYYSFLYFTHKENTLVVIYQLVIIRETEAKKQD